MLWALLITLGLIKLVAACLMLWMPFRYDSAMVARDDPPRSEGSDEDGGSKVADSGSGPHPRRPLPRLPRRGPHGAPPRGPRPRVRIAAHAGQRRSSVSN
jgi:hypothetical protein